MKQEIVSLQKQSTMNWWVESTMKFIQLNYIEHLLILISTITGCVSISSFAYLVGIPI